MHTHWIRAAVNVQSSVVVGRKDKSTDVCGQGVVHVATFPSVWGIANTHTVRGTPENARSTLRLDIERS